MRTVLTIIFLFVSATVLAQKKVALPHGMVFGSKPDTSLKMPIAKLDSFMGRKVRISTTVYGKVVRVIKPKGGWFLVEAGKNKSIEAHFKNYNVTIPHQLAGKIVIIQGVAAKQFKADVSQHYAGDTVVRKEGQPFKKLVIDFEVNGMMVYK